jgi:hypothetical protein
MAKHIMVALSNAAEGREEEFNKWYTEIHIPDVLKVPGVVAAQRFRLSPVQRFEPPFAYGYFALYEVETDNLEETIATIRKRSRTELMPISSAMTDKMLGLIFQPLTERVVRTEK